MLTDATIFSMNVALKNLLGAMRLACSLLALRSALAFVVSSGQCDSLIASTTECFSSLNMFSALNINEI